MLQKEEVTHLQNITKEEEECHQNPQGGCLSCGPNSRQGSRPGGHGQETNILINVWHFLMTVRSTNLVKTLPRNCTEMY